MRRILLVRFSSLGDVILTTPLMRAVKARFPNAEIRFVTKAEFAPLFAHHPALSAVIPCASHQSVQQLARDIRGNAGDVNIDLHGSIRSRALEHLVPGRWSRYRKPRRHRFVIIWTGRAGDLTPVPEQYFEAAPQWALEPDGSPPSIHLRDDDYENSRRIVPEVDVVLAPGAGHPTKRWPADRWRVLATRLSSAGHRIASLGLPEEEWVLHGSGAMMAHHVSLRCAAAVSARARIVVANDSGLMHLATAVGTPVVALFGPTHPSLGFAPYRARSRVVHRPLACRPCSTMGGAHCPAGHHRCMRSIDVAAVEGAIRDLL